MDICEYNYYPHVLYLFTFIQGKLTNLPYTFAPENNNNNSIYKLQLQVCNLTIFVL